MVQYSTFTLDNGLKVVVHEDPNTQMAVMNLMYDVGSKDEDPNKTGFAHLFEHLMFEGSVNIKDFDSQLQKVGGSSNAFTSPDVTNYYIQLPAVNLETAFWLESDRMLGLDIHQEKLDIQKKVVIEEFKQRYLNQPYGDVWLKLRPMVYKEHPYNWPTIGKEISHIEDSTLEEVNAFFKKHYNPQNAVLVVGGNVTTEQVKELAEKWFGPIPAGEKYERNIPQEPKQTEARFMEIEKDVPLNAIYKVWHSCDHNSPDYYPVELLGDILGSGKSSRVYEKLVQEKRLFNSIHMGHSSSFDPGMFIFSGTLNEGVTFEEAEISLELLLQEAKRHPVTDEELFQVKNEAEAHLVFNQVDLMQRCLSLAYATTMGDPNLVNQEAEMIQAVTKEEINAVAEKVLVETNCSTLWYISNQTEEV